MKNSQENTNISLAIAVMTVSDTRTIDTDKSGNYLADSIITAGHHLADRVIETDNKYKIRAKISNWIADENIRVILTTGGTGFTDRDVTPEAISVLLDKHIAGYGELFRMLSYDEVKTSTIQSRAIGGIANGTFIFSMPGSTSACELAWEKILRFQLDGNNQPCNFIDILPRIKQDA